MWSLHAPCGKLVLHYLGFHSWCYTFPYNRHHSQYDGHCNKELSCSCVLLSVVNLLPISEPPCVPLVPRHVGSALQVMEHDVHPLHVCRVVRVECVCVWVCVRGTAVLEGTRKYFSCHLETDCDLHMQELYPLFSMEATCTCILRKHLHQAF